MSSQSKEEEALKHPTPETRRKDFTKKAVGAGSSAEINLHKHEHLGSFLRSRGFSKGEEAKSSNKKKSESFTAERHSFDGGGGLSRKADTSAFDSQQMTPFLKTYQQQLFKNPSLLDIKGSDLGKRFN